MKSKSESENMFSGKPEFLLPETEDEIGQKMRLNTWRVVCPGRQSRQAMGVQLKDDCLEHRKNTTAFHYIKTAEKGQLPSSNPQTSSPSDLVPAANTVWQAKVTLQSEPGGNPA